MKTRKTICPADTIEITYYNIKTFYDGSHSHIAEKTETMTGEVAKSIANIGRVIAEKESRRCWSYIRVYNKTQEWCEDYTVSRWGNMSVRKSIY